uniref:Uncharacterized protein n=2 Tax=Physcomitrium patens TaxID=3218 RepID=A0A2K1JM10_PHYPA|nr:cell number regulator 6-like [Physcomitrium patens]PNR42584.1 hypothetical protein PHYPA_017414 [Physcomitrium patens]|eukprot:XP_024393398.1 cell number regulator 6-like [Physcomitrella patens]
MPLSSPALTLLCSAFVLLRSFAFPPPSSSSFVFIPLVTLATPFLPHACNLTHHCHLHHHATCTGTRPFPRLPFLCLPASLPPSHGIDPQAAFLIAEALFFAWWMCGIYAGLFRQELQRRYHLQNCPCEPCTVHCCLHWYALCQEHREMQGRLSDNVVMPMTVINPPP